MDDPGTAQFISRDPIVEVTREPYVYVGGSPLNSIDPTGLYDPDERAEKELKRQINDLTNGLREKAREIENNPKDLPQSGVEFFVAAISRLDPERGGGRRPRRCDLLGRRKGSVARLRTTRPSVSNNLLMATERGAYSERVGILLRALGSEVTSKYPTEGTAPLSDEAAFVAKEAAEHHQQEINRLIALMREDDRRPSANDWHGYMHSEDYLIRGFIQSLLEFQNVMRFRDELRTRLSEEDWRKFLAWAQSTLVNQPWLLDAWKNQRY